MIRLKLVKGVYSEAWILALCVDGYPKYFAKYENGQDALAALRMTLDNYIFLGYPFDDFKDASFRPQQSCDARIDLSHFN